MARRERPPAVVSVPRANRRRRWMAVLALGGMVVSLVGLFHFVDVRAVGRALSAADPRWLALAVGLVLCTPFTVAGKLWCVVRLAGEPRSLSRCWSAVMAAVALNSLVPGRGGDLVRAAFLATAPDTIAVLVGAVLVERLLDVLSLGLLSLVASLALGIHVAVTLSLAAAGASLVALAVLASGHRLPFQRELAGRAGTAARGLLRRPDLSAGAFALSTLSWAVNIGVMALALRAVGAEVPLSRVTSAVPIAILAGILPISMGGIGTRDATFAWLLSGTAASEKIVAASFLFTALTMWLLGLLGVVALGRETLAQIRRRVRDESATARF